MAFKVAGKVFTAAQAKASVLAKAAAKAQARVKPKSPGKATFRTVAAAKKGPSSRQKAAAAQAKKDKAFAAKQSKQSKALEREFSAFRKGLEPLDVLRKRLGLELGIPGLQAQLDPLQQRALRLGQLQLDLPENIQTLAGRQGKAFRDLLETSKGEDLARQLRDVAISQEFFAGQLTGARGELSEQLGVTQEQRDFDLRAFGQQADLLNTRLARELSGYTITAQREFEAIIGDIRRAEELNDAAVQRAFELAKLEKSAALSAANIKLQAKISGKEETKKSTALRQFNFAISANVNNPNALDSITQSFIQQFPEFTSEFDKALSTLGL